VPRSRRRRLFAEALEQRWLLAADPVASLVSVPTETLIGEDAKFVVRFDNASASDVGYGPYADLFLPATGISGAGPAVDHGITFANATYLGSPVTAMVLTLTAGGVPHPFARDASGHPLVVTPPAGFQVGDQLVVLSLPFSSYTPAQPPADVVVTATV